MKSLNEGGREMELEEKRNGLQVRLNELQQKLQIFPYRKAALMKEFNNELTFGEPAKAESIRTAIQELEKESRDLSSEIKRLEKEGVET